MPQFQLPNGLIVDIDLNPTNTYTIIKTIGMTSFNVYSGIDWQTAVASLTAITDNEPINPNVTYKIEQD